MDLFKATGVDSLPAEKAKMVSVFVSLTEYVFLIVTVILIYFSLFLNFGLPPVFSAIVKFILYAFFVVITCKNFVVYLGKNPSVTNSIASIFGVFCVIFSFYVLIDYSIGGVGIFQFPYRYVQSSGLLFIIFFTVSMSFLLQCLILLALAGRRPPVRPYFTVQFGLTIIVLGQHLALLADPKGVPTVGLTEFDFYITLVIVVGIVVFNGIRFTRVLLAPLPRLRPETI